MEVGWGLSFCPSPTLHTDEHWRKVPAMHSRHTSSSSFWHTSHSSQLCFEPCHSTVRRERQRHRSVFSLFGPAHRLPYPSLPLFPIPPFTLTPLFCIWWSDLLPNGRAESHGKRKITHTQKGDLQPSIRQTTDYNKDHHHEETLSRSLKQLNYHQYALVQSLSIPTTSHTKLITTAFLSLTPIPNSYRFCQRTGLHVTTQL